jgi:hypothetical protein
LEFEFFNKSSKKSFSNVGELGNYGKQIGPSMDDSLKEGTTFDSLE